MKDYVGMLLAKIKAVAGATFTFIPAILATLHKKLSEGDVEGVRAVALDLHARAKEMHEAADAVEALALHVDEVIADGDVTAAELVATAPHVQKAIDEIEDVATGKDEDDKV